MADPAIALGEYYIYLIQENHMLNNPATQLTIRLTQMRKKPDNVFRSRPPDQYDYDITAI
jgi:hypothetical protein